MNNKISYKEIVNISRLVANNNLLNNWSSNAENWTFRQYSIYTSNMMRRLSPNVIKLRLGLELLKSADNHLFNDVVHAFEHNIKDESGDGKPENSHAYLFRESSNIYSMNIYNSAFEKFEITPATKFSNEELMKLFGANVYEMLGATIAQETHALPQLEKMFAGVKRSKEKISQKDWDKVSNFYDVHLDGTELRHSNDLRDTIFSLLDDDFKNQRFIYGFNRVIMLLSHYWCSLEQIVLS